MIECHQHIQSEWILVCHTFKSVEVWKEKIVSIIVIDNQKSSTSWNNLINIFLPCLKSWSSWIPNNCKSFQLLIFKLNKNIQTSKEFFSSNKVKDFRIKVSMFNIDIWLEGVSPSNTATVSDVTNIYCPIWPRWVSKRFSGKPFAFLPLPTSAKCETNLML